MKNNSFHLLPKIFCALQFVIEKITKNPLSTFIAQCAQNLKQSQDIDSTKPERNTNKMRKKWLRVSEVGDKDLLTKLIIRHWMFYLSTVTIYTMILESC